MLKKAKKVLIVGAGFTGAVIARALAEFGISVDVVDSRDHVAGNCHTQRDEATGVLVHVYGPHIFHTDDEEVWNYVCQFGEFAPYINRVKAISAGSIYSLPINLHTINQFYGESFSPSEAAAFIQSTSRYDIGEPRNFEEQALKMVGERLYEAFLRDYTLKQWGRNPVDLPASILKRLPLRFNYDDNYFQHRWQGMPVNGYTELVRRILEHENITLSLSTSYVVSDSSGYDYTFYSGPIDAYFEYKFGYLAYRTLAFEKIDFHGDFQGCAVMNYCDNTVPYTRISEHKHFAPWESHARSVCYREYPREWAPGDIPFYPVRLSAEQEMLRKYEEAMHTEENITFAGRLGTYRYLDMDVTIREALNVSREFLRKHRT
jgi:UDP-galactopyranose mutase